MRRCCVEATALFEQTFAWLYTYLHETSSLSFLITPFLWNPPLLACSEDEHREVVQQCRTVAAAQASDDYSPLDEMYEAAQASAESDASDEEGEGLSALKPKNWKKGNASPV